MPKCNMLGLQINFFFAYLHFLTILQCTCFGIHFITSYETMHQALHKTECSKVNQTDMIAVYTGLIFIIYRLL